MNIQTHQLTFEYLAPEAIKVRSGNPRTHSTKQIHQIAKSIKAFGMLLPVLIDKQSSIIVGEGRFLAAKLLGLAQVPVLQVEHLTEAQIRAYRIADNKLAENSAWNLKQLRAEFEDLIIDDPLLDFDALGFSEHDFEAVMIDLDGNDDPPIPEPPAASAAVTEVGDIWVFGKSRVACGDCRDPKVMTGLMGKEKAAMVVTDAPYNLRADQISGLGKHQHGDFEMASGEMSPAQFIAFLEATIGAMASACRDGALLYLFIDWRHLSELLAACSALKLPLINLCVWAKTNAGMGSLYRSQHELVLVVKKGNAPHINNVQLGATGRYRTNVWTYAGMNTFGAERDEALAMHPTVKPLALVRDAILDVTHRGDLLLDGFLGSGTTLLAAERCGRRCYGIELDPRYVDVCLQRWIKETGEQPIHVASGMTYAERRAHRLTPATA